MRVHEEVQEGIYKSRSGQGWTGAAQLSTMFEALSYATLSLCFGPITLISRSTTALQSQGSDVKCGLRSAYGGGLVKISSRDYIIFVKLWNTVYVANRL
jgi:hypothetical protein